MPFLRMIVLAVAKTCSKLFGLATVTFFGRAPTKDDDKLGAAGILSLTWLFTAFAILVPEAAEMVVPFLPDDEGFLRGAAIATSIVIPMVVGALIGRVHNQPDGAGRAALNVVAGFAYTPVVGLLLLALILVVPFVKLSYLLRQYNLQHMAIMIPEGCYDEVRDHIGDVLAGHDIQVEVHAHPWAMRKVFTWLSWVEGRIFRRGMATRMQRFIGQIDDRYVEVTVHATDLAVLGEREAVSRVFALLAEELDPRKVFLTWDDDSQEVEKDLRTCYDQVENGEPCDRERLEELADRLRDLALDPPEWNAVRRMIYRVAVLSERAEHDKKATR